MDATETIRRVRTEDGSFTLFDARRELHYRSTHGARTESRHVFVHGTRSELRGQTWRIFELGFGGATNFAETLTAAREAGVALIYYALERSPVPAQLITHPDEQATRLARAAIEAPGCWHRGDGVQLFVHQADWRELEHAPFTRADAAYHDPFGPSDDPESWTPDCFRWMRGALAVRGILATYSAATRVRRAMASADLRIASAPGPGRKREVTFASPSADPLACYELFGPDRYR